jgi:F-type H+-transporting ATPase subunit b
MLLATLLVQQEEAPPPLIDVDGTLFVQFGLFLIMLLVLSRLVFRPYLALRGQRSKSIDGAKHEAKEMEGKARSMVADYDARLTKAKQRGGEERMRMRSEAAARERQVLGQARDESSKTVDAARLKLSRDAAHAKTALDAQAQALAKQMVKKILGREVA